MALTNEQKSLIEYYKDHTNRMLIAEAKGMLLKVCPPEEYGEDSDCAVLWELLETLDIRHFNRKDDDQEKI